MLGIKKAVGLLAAAAALAVSGSVFAAEYPCRSVEWIVGWGAGGGSDTFARSIAPGVSEELGVPVKVINMPGASSITAMQEVLSRPADGCTIFSVTPDQITNEITGLTDLSYKTLDPVFRAHVDIGMLHTKADGDFPDWQSVVNWAKAHPNELLVGGTGAASFDEIVVKIIMDSAGVTYRYIPYESASDMHADLLGGRLHVIYDEVSVMSPMIEAGQVNPVLTLAEESLDRYSNVPAAGQLGYEVPPSLWRGVAVRDGTPTEVIASLEGAFMAAADTDKYKEFEQNRMLNLFPGRLGAEEFEALFAREHDMYGRVIKNSP